MLGDLLKREKLRAAEPSTLFAGTTNPQRLHDAPERIERHTHIGWIGHTKGGHGLFHDSTGARWRPGVHTPRRPSSARVGRLGGWCFMTQVDIVNCMGFH